jgi:hypothetical protein
MPLQQVFSTFHFFNDGVLLFEKPVVVHFKWSTYIFNSLTNLYWVCHFVNIVRDAIDVLCVISRSRNFLAIKICHVDARQITTPVSLPFYLHFVFKIGNVAKPTQRFIGYLFFSVCMLGKFF